MGQLGIGPSNKGDLPPIIIDSSRHFNVIVIGGG